MIDTAIAIDFPAVTPRDPGGGPSSHVVADALKGAKVVKAFNTMWARVLGRRPDEAGGHRVLFLSGDAAAANERVADLVSVCGFAPIDLGPIASADCSFSSAARSPATAGSARRKAARARPRSTC